MHSGHPGSRIQGRLRLAWKHHHREIPRQPVLILDPRVHGRLSDSEKLPAYARRASASGSISYAYLSDADFALVKTIPISWDSDLDLVSA